MDFQLCKRGEEFPTSDKWAIERKYNGVRYGLERTRTGWRAHGREIDFPVPEHILDSLPSNVAPGLLLDGEFWHEDDDRSAMSILCRTRVPPIGMLVVFDMPSSFGTYDFRRTRLEKLEFGDSVRIVESSPQVSHGHGERVLDEFLDYGFEGIVMKRRDSLYMPGRHRTWLKFKERRTR